MTSFEYLITDRAQYTKGVFPGPCLTPVLSPLSLSDYVLGIKRKLYAPVWCSTGFLFVGLSQQFLFKTLPEPPFRTRERLGPTLQLPGAMLVIPISYGYFLFDPEPVAARLTIKIAAIILSSYIGGRTICHIHRTNRQHSIPVWSRGRCLERDMFFTRIIILLAVVFAIVRSLAHTLSDIIPPQFDSELVWIPGSQRALNVLSRSIDLVYCWFAFSTFALTLICLIRLNHHFFAGYIPTGRRTQLVVEDAILIVPLLVLWVAICATLTKD